MSINPNRHRGRRVPPTRAAVRAQISARDDRTDAEVYGARFGRVSAR